MKSVDMADIIECKIHLIRGYKVMLDSDLAELYGVEVKQLKRQVRRNRGRFPNDFMFQLSKEEYDALRCHFGALKRGGHSKYLPYVFTEQGVAMLSSVLSSERAIEVNIQIMRTFSKLRKMAVEHRELAHRLDEMEQKYDSQFKVIFDAIRLMIASPDPDEKKIGFIREKRAVYGAGGGVSA